MLLPQCCCDSTRVRGRYDRQHLFLSSPMLFFNIELDTFARCLVHTKHLSSAVISSDLVKALEYSWKFSSHSSRLNFSSNSHTIPAYSSDSSQVFSSIVFTSSICWGSNKLNSMRAAETLRLFTFSIMLERNAMVVWFTLKVLSMFIVLDILEYVTTRMAFKYASNMLYFHEPLTVQQTISKLSLSQSSSCPDWAISNASRLARWSSASANAPDIPAPCCVYCPLATHDNAATSRA